MRRWYPSHGGRTTLDRTDGDMAGPRALILGVAILALATGLRAWMLYPSWFYADDLRLLAQASRSPFDLSHLLAPYDSQFMPGGRAIVWAVAHSGDVAANWELAATITLGLWILSGAACLWMLWELFGPRWGVLGLLGLHATSALTAPATMWWAAALNQLPLLIVWYAAVATWVRYLRGRSHPWLAATLLILAVGTLFYVKTLLVLPVLVIVLLGWFVPGTPYQRVRVALRTYWPAAIVLGSGASGFLWFYRNHVPQPFSRSPSVDLAGSLAGEMLGRSFATLALGGPWRWASNNPPVAIVDPPPVMLVVVLVAVGSALLTFVLRGRAGGLVVVLVGLAGAYFLVLTTRASQLGPIVGREPRYLTETICVLVLGLGLLTLPVREATGALEPGRGTRSRLRLSGIVALTVCLSGAASSALYARVWHASNPVDDYLATFAEDAARAGPVAVADTVLPSEMSLYVHPYNTLAVLAPLVTDAAYFPDVTDRLTVPDAEGALHVAVIEPSSHGVEGPTPDCGWRVQDVGRTIPLDSGLPHYDWWVRVPYRASAPSPVTVTVGGVEHDATIMPGLGSVYVHHVGSFGTVEISGLRDGTVACIGRIQVGVTRPGGPMDVG